MPRDPATRQQVARALLLRRACLRELAEAIRQCARHERRARQAAAAGDDDIAREARRWAAALRTTMPTLIAEAVSAAATLALHGPVSWQAGD